MTQLNGCLRSQELEKDITWVEEARAAALSDVLRVHEWPYVKQIQSTL
jgi:acetoin utilization deacetylase AcuC-like enzyme